MDMWNDAAEYWSRITDKLGKKIDPGIFELVICLNLLDIPTKQSCEGHLGWGLPYPWVDVEPEKQTRFRCYQLVSRYYKGRSVDSEAVLVFHGYRMQSAGALFSPLLPESDQAFRLRLYQEEMASFTSFLKSLLL